jgi:tetratricopeptide (TPR) repeat protein
MALSHAGWVRCYLGRPREAISDFERVMMLSPREVTLFRVYGGLTFAHLMLQDYDEAVRWGWRALDGNPNFTPTYRALAAALAHLGRIEEAREVARRLLTLMPNFSADTETFVFRESGKLDPDPRRHAQGRLAGIGARAFRQRVYWWSMIFSENRCPLFGIMLRTSSPALRRRRCGATAGGAAGAA